MLLIREDKTGTPVSAIEIESYVILELDDGSTELSIVSISGNQSVKFSEEELNGIGNTVSIFIGRSQRSPLLRYPLSSKKDGDSDDVNTMGGA